MKKARKILVFILLTSLIYGIFVSTNVPNLITVQTTERQNNNLQTTGDITVQGNTTWGDVDNDVGYAMVLDTVGYIYCAGYTSSPGYMKDIALIKFYPNGTQVWNTTWGTIYDDVCYDLAVDTEGYLYCAGYTYQPGTDKDFVVIKYYPNGTKIWSTTWSTNYEDICYGIAVDAAGYIYCAGYKTLGTKEVILVKFDPDGTENWTMTWGSGTDEMARDVALDMSGNAYLLIDRHAYAGNDYFILHKVLPNGTKAWETFWGETDKSAHPYGLALDAAGNIYCIGGIANVRGGDSDMIAVKFDSNGVNLWSKTWGGSRDEVGYGVAVATAGSFYAIGYSTSFGDGSKDIALVLFDSNGDCAWRNAWGSSGAEEGYGMVLDAAGNKYAVGCTNSHGAGNYDLVVVKFDNSTLSCSSSIGTDQFAYATIAFTFVIALYALLRRSWSLGKPPSDSNAPLLKWAFHRR
jgi:uncharacterized delta-60 repeat protein